MTAARLLVVDDEEDVVFSFRRILPKPDYEVLAAATGEEALAIAAAERPDVILMDVRMPGAGGLATLRELRRIDARTPVILMTAYASAQGTIEAMKAGAFDHVVKPFDIEAMRATVRDAVKAARAMRGEVRFDTGAVPATGAPDPADGEALVGRGPAMRAVFKLIGKVAAGGLPVLVTGETGTGKELAARAIYQHGPRAAAPFLAVNCAAIPADLLESELFGHRRGAFTGATADKRGKFEACDGGTLFLDEVGELPPAAQAKLLRVLERGELERVGDPHPGKVDVRVIAATNRDLKADSDAGRFRADLYYRLRVVEVAMPPLRDRPEDIETLANHLLALHAPAAGHAEPPRLQPGALARLGSHPWPGNVRELENTLRAALARTRSTLLQADDIELETLGAAGAGIAPSRADTAVIPAAIPLSDDDAFDAVFDAIARRQPLPEGYDAFDVVERVLVIKALEAEQGNQSRASRFLGITRNTLRKRIKKYGIKLTRGVEEGG